MELLGILILGLFAGAAIKEKELKVPITVTPPTKIEQVSEACLKRNIIEYRDHGFGFKCNTKDWK